MTEEYTRVIKLGSSTRNKPAGESHGMCREAVMRRVLMLFVAAASLFTSVGCMGFQAYSADPMERTGEYLNQSENLRQINAERRRFWMVDQPSLLTFDRLSGAVGPAPGVLPFTSIAGAK